MTDTILVVTPPTATTLVVTPQVGSTLITAQPGPTGPSGTPASIDAQVTAGTAISGHMVVKGSVAVTPCDAGTLTDAGSVLGIALNSAIYGNPVSVRRFGLLSDPSFSFTPGLPVFCGPAGLMTQTLPASPWAVFLLRIGAATSPTSMIVSIEPPVILA